MDFSETVKRYIVANPGIVPDGNLPGIGNFNGRTNQNAFSQRTSEQAQ